MKNLICPFCRSEHSSANENDIGGKCSGCGKLFYRCPKCDSWKWATKKKNEAWQCRECGLIQVIDGFDIKELKTEKITKEFKTEVKLNLLQKLLKWLQNKRK